MLRIEREGKKRDIDYFLSHRVRLTMTFEILRFMDEREGGCTFSFLRKKLNLKRVNFINNVLIPCGYIQKKNAYKKTTRLGKPYIHFCVAYSITPEGRDFILELENKYKEQRMKHLYDHLV